MGLQKTGNSLQSLANSVCDGDMKQLAEKAGSFFQSVTTDFRPISPADCFSIGFDYHVPDRCVISTCQVEELRAIKTSKASGPDGIPNWVLRDFAECLSGPVCALFNSSLRQGFVPQIWKSADVCPLAKVPSPSVLEKHLRPISLTPVLSKVLERFVAEWVMESAKDIIDNHQFGSLRGSSTAHALVELVYTSGSRPSIPQEAVYACYC